MSCLFINHPFICQITLAGPTEKGWSGQCERPMVWAQKWVTAGTLQWTKSHVRFPGWRWPVLLEREKGFWLVRLSCRETWCCFMFIKWLSFVLTYTHTHLHPPTHTHTLGHRIGSGLACWFNPLLSQRPHGCLPHTHVVRRNSWPDRTSIATLHFLVIVQMSMCVFHKWQ